MSQVTYTYKGKSKSFNPAELTLTLKCPITRCIMTTRKKVNLDGEEYVQHGMLVSIGFNMDYFYPVSVYDDRTMNPNCSSYFLLSRLDELSLIKLPAPFKIMMGDEIPAILQPLMDRRAIIEFAFLTYEYSVDDESIFVPHWLPVIPTKDVLK